jgi:hypothetical protein
LDATVSSYQEWMRAEPSASQTILFYHVELSSGPNTLQVQDSTFRPDEQRVSPTWFKYVVAIKKFCRDDNLIGMHLLLDLGREYLVLAMVERDNMHHTNVHRYGDNQRLPDAIKLSLVDESDPGRMRDYIAKLAFAYDHKLASMIEGYTSRYDTIMGYIERSKAHLLR